MILTCYCSGKKESEVYVERKENRKVGGVVWSDSRVKLINLKDGKRVATPINKINQ